MVRAVRLTGRINVGGLNLDDNEKAGVQSGKVQK